MGEPEILLLEPFYDGSHGQLMELLDKLPRTCLYKLPSLPLRERHWRARTAALVFSETVPEIPSLKTLFASSVLNLSELVALRPDLGKLRKILYFHENHLVYPVQDHEEHDYKYQYGYNEILSSLVADIIVFNSQYNMESFLTWINTYLSKIPDNPRNLAVKIRPKCRVVYPPIVFYDINTPDSCGAESLPSLSRFSTSDVASDGDASSTSTMSQDHILHVVWPHCYSEQNKNPDLFFKTLSRLKYKKKLELNLKITVLGDQPGTAPPSYIQAQKDLKVKMEDGKFHDRIEAWGDERNERYHELLYSADVVVSTTQHEFFSVSMLDAVKAGCTPLCPDRAIYKEFYPKICRFRTRQHFYKLLKTHCEEKKIGNFQRGQGFDMDLERFSWNVLRQDYEDLLYGDI